ncbi:chaplin [Streptomyces sp. NPDC049915]|uniref:chaplin n=1 Tax=Streptomyces sp. NPDC049915 TaxID=3155510 RepID=UPI0034139768
MAAASGAMVMVPAAHADSTAEGSLAGSPGVGSCNGVQLPVDLPVNVSGSTANVVGIGNPVFGHELSNTSGEKPQQPTPVEEVGAVGALAGTGTDGMLPAALAGGALLLGGAAPYRRHRPDRQH